MPGFLCLPAFWCIEQNLREAEHWGVCPQLICPRDLRSGVGPCAGSCSVAFAQPGAEGFEGIENFFAQFPFQVLV